MKQQLPPHQSSGEEVHVADVGVAPPDGSDDGVRHEGPQVVEAGHVSDATLGEVRHIRRQPVVST